MEDTITVTITTEDFKSADSYDRGDKCPLAMAIKRQFSEFSDALVKTTFVYLKKNITELLHYDMYQILTPEWLPYSHGNYDRSGLIVFGARIDALIERAKAGEEIDPITVTLKKL